MQAAFVSEPNKVEVKEVPRPALRNSGVMVKVLRAHVLSFTNLAVAGIIPAPIPFIPGPTCIGEVVELGSEADPAHALEKGTLVVCMPTIGHIPDGILQGWIGFGTPSSKKLQEVWHDGGFAEYACFPATNVFPITGDAKKLPLSKLVLTNYGCIAYGAAVKAGVTQGVSVGVAGATGGLGRMAIKACLALGASKVYALGRNKALLGVIAKEAPSRIEVINNLDEQKGPLFDVYLDALGGGASVELSSKGLALVKNRGTAVFFGGVQGDMPVSYPGLLFRELTIKGTFMYAPEVVDIMLRMLGSGQVLFDDLDVQDFKLAEFESAVAKAAEWKGNRFAVLKMDNA